MFAATRRVMMFATSGGALPRHPAGTTADRPREGAGPVGIPDYGRTYGEVAGETHPVPAFAFADADPELLRADVAYAGGEPLDTIVIEPRHHRLFLVAAGGRRATRYGIAVGPEAAGFSGRAVVAARRAWPEWQPPAMPPNAWARLQSAGATSAATPLPAGLVPGGRSNPRGARGLFLASGGRYVTFSIHGTPSPEGIGSDVEAGCVGLVDQDAIDLFDRAGEGTQVFVDA